jgi:predicted RNase H-like HicB family nuclease
VFGYGVVMKAEINMDLRITFIKVAGGYNALSDVFASVGVGSTKAKAEKSLKEALDITFKWCIKHGTLFEALESEGFKQKVVLPPKTKEKSYKKINYNLPLGQYGKEKRQYA